MPLAALGIIGAVGSIGGAAIGANAAGNAADAQAQAAMYAADQQRKIAEENLGFQKEMWNTQQANISPWLQSGGTALNQINALMGLPEFQSYQTPSSITANTMRQRAGLPIVSGTLPTPGLPGYGPPGSYSASPAVGRVPGSTTAYPNRFEALAALRSRFRGGRSLEA